MATQTQHHFEVQAECKSCEGTGLYVGLAERDGAAVVCHTCKGTGEVTLSFDWDDFTGRKGRDGVAHVIRCNPGIVVGTDGKDGPLTFEDFGGIPYTDWQALHNPQAFPAGTEMRRFTCPAWWYQSSDSGKKPNWDECGFGMFSRCQHFGTKGACWERWDQEFVAKEAETDGDD